VAELVRAFSRPFNPCLGHGVSDQGTDSPLIFETRQGCFEAEKQASGIRTLGPARFQVGGDGSPHVAGQRQLVDSTGLAVDGDAPSFPVNVVQSKVCDLATSQAEPSQQQQHGVISSSGRRGPVAARQQLFNMVARQRLRHRGEGPTRNGRHAGGQIRLEISAVLGEAQERAQCGSHQLCPFGDQSSRALLHELDDIRGAQGG
jgi:hypothetical protein